MPAITLEEVLLAADHRIHERGRELFSKGAVCKHVYAVALAGLEAPEQFGKATVKKNSALEKLIVALETLSDEESWTLLEALERLKPEILEEYAFNIAQREAGW